MAKWSCVGLIVLGVLLCVADVLDWFYVAHRSLPFYVWHLWRWGLGCIIAGVLGLVALEVARTPRKGGDT